MSSGDHSSTEYPFLVRVTDGYEAKFSMVVCAPWHHTIYIRSHLENTDRSSPLNLSSILRITRF